ncbi:MAG: hypothetical protein Q7S99_05385 [Parvibaculum sp.]|nr:hypothetical protein [Parvibaculum sp.]
MRATALNAIQEELALFLEGLGVTLNGAVPNQIYTAFIAKLATYLPLIGGTLTGALTSPNLVVKAAAAANGAVTFRDENNIAQAVVFWARGADALTLSMYADDGTTVMGTLILKESGAIEVSADPTTVLGIATKQYVDATAITPDATTTTKGKSELATDAETQALTDTVRTVTPSNLGALLATITQKGIVELADSTEFGTGTDSSRALTASLFTKSLGANGYIKFPGGLILQWGTVSAVPDDSNSVVTLPVTYASTHYAAGATIYSTANLTSVDQVAVNTTSLSSVTIYQRTPGANALNAFWWSIGK